MSVEKDSLIYNALDTVKQVRKALKKAFPDSKFLTTLQKKNQATTILVKYNGGEIPEATLLEKELKVYVGFIDIIKGFRLPLWHKKNQGYHHYQVDCIKYKDGTWKEIAVGQEEKTPSWRFWRLTHDEFEMNLKPYLNRWKERNIEILYAVIVENKVQSAVAASAGIKRQTLNNTVKRAFKIYMEANAISQNQSIPTAKTEKE